MARDCEFYELRSSLLSYYNYCIKKGKEISEDTYENYCTNFNHDNCPIKNQSDSSGCFITTILCNILGKKDDDKIMENMRGFRENILKNNPKYYNILWEYDRIGPVIANCINNDPEKLKLANNLYTGVLTNINEHIENGENEKAVARYQIMVLELIKHYNLKEVYDLVKDSFNVEKFDVKSSGHGKVRIKPKEKLV